MPASEHVIVRTAFISPYPPRQCGVATFTGELSRVTADREIAAIHPVEPIPPYAIEVHHRIRRHEQADYARTAQHLDRCADVASIQFDPEAWGGEDGAFVLDFVAALRIPFAVTLHRVRRKPTPAQRSIVFQLVDSGSAAVALSKSAADALTADYGVEPGRVQVIPYGVPDVPIMATEMAKEALGVSGSDLILGVGLLGPGKGFERVIEVLPAIVRAHRAVTFAIVGATHPDVRRRDGEAYRERLAKRAAELGVAAHVRFVNEFVGRSDLTRWVQAADVVVTPSDDLRSTDSGTLAHAMGAGRAIVATRFPHAVELLGDGRGTLVSGTPEALEAALLRLLGDPALRTRMGSLAHEHSRDWAWVRIGATYQELFARVAAGSAAPLVTTPG